MTQKAAGVGFDWSDPLSVMDKVEEELHELRDELATHMSPESNPGVRDELGDLLFTLANLARQLDLDPEAVLAGANAKFRRRFETMERELAARGLSLVKLDQGELEEAWIRAKRAEAD